MDRHGSLRESLRLAREVISEGYILLIFPEGTRSTTGVMADFKPSLGYLALTNKVDILPMYLDGHARRAAEGPLWPAKRDDRRAHRAAAHVRGAARGDGRRRAERAVPRGVASRRGSGAEAPAVNVVTGATGFLGRHVSPRCASAGYRCAR